MKSLIKKEIGDRIKRAREACDLSQIRLAEILDVDNVTVSRWERGVHSPTDSQLQELRKILDVGRDYFSIHPTASPTLAELQETIARQESRHEKQANKIETLEDQLADPQIQRFRKLSARDPKLAGELLDDFEAALDGDVDSLISEIDDLDNKLLEAAEPRPPHKIKRHR